MSAKSDVSTVQAMKEAHAAIVSEVSKVIMGQQSIIDNLLIAMLSRGHCLLVGVPGLAKTLLISTLAEVLEE